ncbi:MAG: adenylosuccinate lyase [Deltaproteobacteria bacterium]|nr:adenylosuccinate lyase [Deltaproteobacteria bacterium]
MILRYTRPEMGALWADESRFQQWLNVELAVLEVLGGEGVVPTDAAAQIRRKAKIDVKRILELEDTLRHDVIAFTTSIAEQVGGVGRYFHYGLTSSDIVDTALSLLLKRALENVALNFDRLETVLAKQALRYRQLPGIGRTHGVHAEPTSFGLKFLGWLAEFRRQRIRLNQAIEQASYGKLSGAVGSYGALSPEVERKALAKLGLKPEAVATQVLPRDRHAEIFSVLAGIGGSIERVSVELRHLQRTEVNEIQEQFGKGQKGSSAMPHKKNPISAENLTGCARLLRGYAVAALENVALWHERDISHSSVERVIAPDATILVDYMLHRLAGILEGLNVLDSNVALNLDRTKGIYFSGHVLLKLVESGMSREEAYRIVQKCAHSAWAEGRWFGDELMGEKVIREKFTREQLGRILNVKNYLKHVDTIYGRVLGNEFKKPKKTSKR